MSKPAQVSLSSDANAPLSLVPPSPAAAERLPAGFWCRWVAAMVDAVILFVPQLPINFVVQFVFRASAKSGSALILPMLALQGVAILFSSTLSFAYYGYFYKTKGSTPGKSLLGIEVINIETGQYLEYRTTFAREFAGKTLSFLIFGFGFLMAAFRQDKRTLHDLLAKTQVVYKSK